MNFNRMRLHLALMCAVVLAGCNPVRYYIVRHAEREAAVMTSDVPLSSRGQQQAQALKAVLLLKKIDRIFATNFVRTKATAEPLAAATNLKVETYAAGDSVFVAKLKQKQSGAMLVVGHSNTIDDLINSLIGRNEMTDLPDTTYGDLFIITKKGNRYTLQKSRYW